MINTNKRPELNKRFSVDQNTDKLITIDPQNGITIVDLEKIGDLVEEFHKKVVSGEVLITIKQTDGLFIKHK